MKWLSTWIERLRSALKANPTNSSRALSVAYANANTVQPARQAAAPTFLMRKLLPV
jgi:hypothetical protein